MTLLAYVLAEALFKIWGERPSSAMEVRHYISWSLQNLTPAVSTCKFCFKVRLSTYAVCYFSMSTCSWRLLLGKVDAAMVIENDFVHCNSSAQILLLHRTFILNRLAADIQSLFPVANR